MGAQEFDGFGVLVFVGFALEKKGDTIWERCPLILSHLTLSESPIATPTNQPKFRVCKVNLAILKVGKTKSNFIVMFEILQRNEMNIRGNESRSYMQSTDIQKFSPKECDDMTHVTVHAITLLAQMLEVAHHQAEQQAKMEYHRCVQGC